LCSRENRNIWGSQQEIQDRARVIGERHSFEQRVKVLIDAVQELI